MALVDLETAALFGCDPSPLQSLLQDICDPIPSKAKMACDRWEIACEASRDLLYLKVAQLAQCSACESTRVLALRLMELFLVGEQNDYSGWKLLTFESQNSIKSVLLITLAHAEDVDVRKALTHLIFEIADYRPIEGSIPVWPELIGFLYQCLASCSERLIIDALSLIAYSPEYVRDTLLPHQRNMLPFLHQKLTHFLASQKHAVRLVSIRASVQFIMCLGKQDRDLFQDLASPIMQAFSHTGEQATSHILLDLLHRLDPEFFTSNCTDWLKAANCLLSFAEIVTLQPKTRFKALRLFVRLATSAFPSHHMVSSVPITKMFKLLFTMMCDITPSDEAWLANSSDLHKHDVEGVECTYARFLFGEVADIVGGHLALSFAYVFMPENAESGDWRVRHTCMMAISMLAPALGQQDERMEESVDKLMDLALKTMPDPHPRVRWAAAFAIKCLRDRHPAYLTPYNKRVTSLLQNLIDTEVHARVKARLEAAQLSFWL